MNAAHPPRRILALGHLGGRNLGDEAMFAALRSLVSVNLATDRAPDRPVRWLVPVPDPQNAPAYPDNVQLLPYSARRLLDELRSCDAYLVCGGTSFHDQYQGAAHRRHTRTMAKFIALSAAARILGKPVLLLGIGVGPFSRAGTRALTRVWARLATRIVVRDAASHDFLAASGLQSPRLTQARDLALLLAPALAGGATEARRIAPVGVRADAPVAMRADAFGEAWADASAGDRSDASIKAQGDALAGTRVAAPVGAPDTASVLINVMQARAFHGHTPAEVAALYDALAQALVRAHPGARFDIVAVGVGAVDNDIDACAAFGDALRRHAPCAQVTTAVLTDPQAFVARARGADIVVTTRLHAAVLAYLAGARVLAIAYHPKIPAVFATLAPGGDPRLVLITPGAGCDPAAALDQIAAAPATGPDLSPDFAQGWAQDRAIYAAALLGTAPPPASGSVSMSPPQAHG